MATKPERQAAHDAVAAYHEAQLGSLVARVGEAIAGFQAGELDAFEIDAVIFQYSRAAKELWKFCNMMDVFLVAQDIQDRPPVDWWTRGAPKKR